MKIRLRHRIAALTVLCLVPVVTLSSIALVRLAARYLIDEAEADAARLADQAERATRFAMLRGDRALVGKMLEAFAHQEGVQYLRLYDAAGVLRAPTMPAPQRLELASSHCTKCHPDPRTTVLPKGECAHWAGPNFVLHYPIHNDLDCASTGCHPTPSSQRLLGLIEVGVDGSKIQSRIRQLRAWAGVWGIVVLAAAALPLLSGLQRAVEHPLAECLRLVREISRNNLSVRSRMRRSDEWGQLLGSFDSMVSALRSARVALEALNRDLEGQVIQRTRELESALERAKESDSLKTEFLANLSHEFSTPLQGVIGYAQLLLDGIDGEVTDAQRRDLDAILRNGRRLLEWSEDLLELARLEANRRYLCVDRIRLDDLVQEVFENVQQLAARKPVEIVQSIEPDCPCAWGDVAAVRRVLLHVVDNALRHTEEGQVQVSARGDGEGWVEIVVADTGPGMDPDVVRAALKGFGSKGGGGGLAVGLSMARRLVEIHGGTFEVQSAPGEGTEVSIRLPSEPMAE